MATSRYFPGIWLKELKNVEIVSQDRWPFRQDMNRRPREYKAGTLTI